MNPRIIDAVAEIIYRRSFKTDVRQACRRSRPKPRTTLHGGPQGSALGPILFITEVDSLLKMLTAAGIKAVMYSDDLALLFSWHITLSEQDMQTMTQDAILVVERWSLGRFSKSTLGQTSYTVFGITSRTNFTFLINGKPISNDEHPNTWAFDFQETLRSLDTLKA